ncbi:MAG: hypothetical protein L0Y39_10020 [Methylococcaceae bacterium]|nr:hypothetical protein [Methylococcaceae bacterium]
METEVAVLTLPQMETLASSVLRANRPESKHGEVTEMCHELIRTIKNNMRLFTLAENPMLLCIIALAGEGFLNARIQIDALRFSLIERLLARLTECGSDQERVTGVLMEMILPCLGAMIDRAEVQSFLDGRLKDPLERMETKSAIYQAALALEAGQAMPFGERFGLVYIAAGKSIIGSQAATSATPSGWRRLVAWIRPERIAPLTISPYPLQLWAPGRSNHAGGPV